MVKYIFVFVFKYADYVYLYLNNYSVVYLYLSVVFGVFDHIHSFKYTFTNIEFKQLFYECKKINKKFTIYI